MSALAGVAALLLGAIPIFAQNGTSISFVLSTVGVTAVLLGVRAIAIARRTYGRAGLRLGWTGVLTGIAGTGLMVAQTIGFHIAVGGTSLLTPFAVRPEAGTEPAAQPLSPPTVFDLAGIQEWLRAAATSPVALVCFFILLTVVMCVGAVTSLRWLVRAEKRLRHRIRRRHDVVEREESAWMRPRWERIDGTSVYRD